MNTRWIGAPAAMFALALALALALAVPAAGQVGVQVNISPPPLNQLKMADLWKLQVVNLGRTPLPVYFFGTITEERDGLVADGTSSAITLRPGMNMLTGRHVEPVDVGYGDPRYERALVRTGGAPSGVYEICVQAILVETGGVVGESCITHDVSLFSPPILISPTAGEVVTDVLPTFVWTPPGGGRQAFSQSRIVITAVYGRQSFVAAVGANPPWFEGQARGTTFQYPAAAKRFQEGDYAWRVISIDPETGREVAESEVEYFKWQPQQSFVFIPVVLQKIPGIPNAITDELLAPCSGTAGVVLDKDMIVTQQGTGISRIQVPGGQLQINN